MAEPGAPLTAGGGRAGFDFRRILLVAGIVVIILVTLGVLFIRGCASSSRSVKGYSVIYSNLNLKDAANAIARLKELAIPYEIRDEGQAIAVPKDKADQARLGLAEKNLPAGGVVGWEIFDESKLGATDFDRRIQLIRAISGELSRTIQRIQAVEDARVQIVLPETRLFAETVAPVTASVMLRLRPGGELTAAKINGIVHLVASSVENLQTENVTVIDNTGRILTANLAQKIKKEAVQPSVGAALAEVRTEIEKTTTHEAVVVTNEAAASGEVKAAELPEKVLSVEEKILLMVEAKKQMELDLTGRAQEIINRFYPPNSAIVKVNVELIVTEPSAKKPSLKELSAIILVDNRVELSPELKHATFKAVAASIGYDKSRGDNITLEMVPFHLATPSPEIIKKQVEQALPVVKPGLQRPKFVFPAFLTSFGLGPYLGILMVIVIVFIVRRLRRGRQKSAAGQELKAVEAAEPLSPEKNSVLEQIKKSTKDNPEKIAEMLKKWLSE